MSLGFQELYLPLDDLQSRDGRADLASGSTVETEHLNSTDGVIFTL